jgi:hypothetical protein
MASRNIVWPVSALYFGFIAIWDYRVCGFRYWLMLQAGMMCRFSTAIP